MKETTMTLTRAQEIVDAEFDRAGWDERSRPSIDDAGALNDGRHSEPARLESRAALIEQCRTWIKDCGDERR